MARALSLVLVLLFAGCPEETSPPAAEEGGAAAETVAEEPEERGLPAEEALAIYRRVMLAPAEQRDEVRRDEGLAGPGGEPLEARLATYRQAIAVYAREHPEEWGDFVERLEAQRALEGERGE